MGLESYVLRLQKGQHLTTFDRGVLFFLEVLEGCYRSGVEKRRKKETQEAYRANIPVISVGNITAGGTGKTPCIVKMAQLLMQEGKHPAIISRGYKSGLEKKGGIVSDGKEILLSPKEAGDEPYMLARMLPTVPVYIGKNRILSVRKAQEHGADVLLLDDGFQYWPLERVCDVVLIDCTNPFGYEHVLPRGLLREPLDALKRSDVFLLTKCSQVTPKTVEDIEARLSAYASIPIIRSDHAPSRCILLSQWIGGRNRVEADTLWKGNAFLLTGIGNPDSFMETAQDYGISVVGKQFFPDHYDFAMEDVRDAEKAAVDCGAECIVITEKDAVKLMHMAGIETMSLPLYVLTITMDFHEDGEQILKQKWEGLW